MEMVLKLFMGFLADYIIAFVKNLKAARADGPALWQTAELIITQINDAHPDWSGQQKRDFAFDAIKAAGKELLKDVEKSAVESLGGATTQNADITDSTVNSMIELIVQKLRAK